MSARIANSREVELCHTEEMSKFHLTDQFVPVADTLYPFTEYYVITGSIEEINDSFLVDLDLYFKHNGLESSVGSFSLLQQQKFNIPVMDQDVIPENPLRELVYQIASRNGYFWKGLCWDQPSIDREASNYYFTALEMIRDNWYETCENRKDLYEYSRTLVDSAVALDSGFVMARILQYYVYDHAKSLRLWYDDSTREAVRRYAGSLRQGIQTMNTDMPEIALVCYSLDIPGIDTAECERAWQRALRIRPNYPLVYR